MQKSRVQAFKEQLHFCNTFLKLTSGSKVLLYMTTQTAGETHFTVLRNCKGKQERKTTTMTTHTLQKAGKKYPQNTEEIE